MCWLVVPEAEFRSACETGNGDMNCNDILILGWHSVGHCFSSQPGCSSGVPLGEENTLGHYQPRSAPELRAQNSLWGSVPFRGAQR